VVAVDDLSGDEPGRQCRQELEQAHEAEIPGAVRKVVHLPAERDQQHLVGGGAQQARGPQAHERALAEQIGGGSFEAAARVGAPTVSESSSRSPCTETAVSRRGDAF